MKTDHRFLGRGFLFLRRLVFVLVFALASFFKEFFYLVHGQISVNASVLANFKRRVGLYFSIEIIFHSVLPVHFVFHETCVFFV